MSKIYVKEELGAKVQLLHQHFDVVTASDKGIIMLTRNDWDKVCNYISAFDEKTQGLHLDFFECESLWTTCFWICNYNDDEDSFMAIFNHDMFMRVCHTCKVQTVLLECPYDIPTELFLNNVGGEPRGKCTFEIEVEDN